MEFYKDRDDRVIYRSIKFDPNKKVSNNIKDYSFEDNHMKQ